MTLVVFLIVIGGVVGFAVAAVILLAKLYYKVDQGQALIVNTMGNEPVVTFTGRHVLPVFHRAETMDISVKTIEIDRRGKEGLICADNIRADIKVMFFVRVNKTADDVLKVAQMIGCNRASDQRTLEDLFNAKFSEALKTVGKQLEFIDLYSKREEFKDRIIQVIGRDLNGYVLEDAAIDYLEQTPLTALDDNNILDAQGIRKITELTATERIRTNQLANNEKKLVRKQDTETIEAILELDRQRSDAEAKQQREIATIRAREAAEQARIEAEERLKAERARIKTDEELQIARENQMRQVQVAAKHRERAVSIEVERSEKDRMLEAITRERETELSRIAKEKALEIEKKDIADVVRQRISVEKAVAEEEEAIKAIRIVEEAKRGKEAAVINAEAEAQEGLVKEIKKAEAEEMASRFKAKERLTLAESELAAAEKLSLSKVKLAEGIQAEEAAAGLAKARVREADAIAHEKFGMADARVIFEKRSAEARGQEIEASAVERLGLAKAKVTEEQGFAEAKVTAEQGLAAARVTQESGAAQASVREKLGTAEAGAIQSRLLAEAAGIAEKAKSMKALDEAGRGHEEFRLRLDKEKAVELEAIGARARVAESQAQVLGHAFSEAHMQVISDGSFFEKVMGALSASQAVDGFVQGSATTRAAFKEYLDGKRSLPADLTQILGEASAEGVRDLTIAAVLGQLAAKSDGEQKQALTRLLDMARKAGIDGTRVG